MKIEKASWETTKDQVCLTMPFQKVDVEQRLVIGFATLNNVDSHNDVVLAEASQLAFLRFRGNIREMHDKIAAGKLVNFSEEEFYDVETDNFYAGILVTAYVSKGAPQTWEKVLDGTLTGFSIGGEILEAENQYVAEMDRTIRYIKDYELFELSLVDNPANKLANVFSITKTADGKVMKGQIADVAVENVFYCKTDGLAKASKESVEKCVACSKPMENVGWFESDTNDRTEKVRNVIKKYKSGNVSKVVTTSDFKGGVIVPENENENNATADEIVNPDAVDSQDDDKKETEKVAEVDEVEDVSFEKLINDIRSELTKNAEANEASLTDISAKIEKVGTEFSVKFDELANKHGELSQKFSGLKEELSTMEKRVGGVESETATRKSSDLGGSKDDSKIEKNESKWGGFFAVDNL